MGQTIWQLTASTSNTSIHSGVQLDDPNFNQQIETAPISKVKKHFVVKNFEMFIFPFSRQIDKMLWWLWLLFER
jgi:hypothetical protein